MSIRILWIGLLGLLCVVPRASAFFFYWATQNVQCGTYELTWSAGTGPFSAAIIPIYGQPFFYDIPDSAYVNNFGRYEIQVQLSAGTSYVILMSDATGTGTGGSSQIVRVQVSNMTECLYTAPTNATNLDFTYTVSGVAEQCERGFELSWTGGREYGPYNFTIVPLDQSFRPYDVALENGVTSMSDWQLNMTTGTRFTVMMNNAAGYGRGGVAGIYEVAAGGDDNCVVQSLAPTGSWPIGLATNTLPPATLPVTQPAGSGTNLSGGAIAGVVIGVVAGLALLGLVLLFLLRRKRRRRAESKRIKENEVDLAEGYGNESGLMRGQSHESSVDGSYLRLDPFIGGQSEPVDDSGEGTVTSAGFAGLGAGLGTARSINRPTSEESDGVSGPGIAGPLPTKSQGASSPARSQPTRRPDSGNAQGIKNEILAQPGESRHPLQPPINPPHTNQGRTMRVINHDDSASLPAIPPGAMIEDRRNRSGPTFRRHEDAGRIPIRPRDQEEIVDLPPLYTDVPRDGPEYTPSDTEGRSPISYTRGR